jgi:hypothetical protein
MRESGPGRQHLLPAETSATTAFSSNHINYFNFNFWAHLISLTPETILDMRSRQLLFNVNNDTGPTLQEAL